MPIETITLELQNEERDVMRVIPFTARKTAPFRWNIIPLLALIFIVGGLFLFLYLLTTKHEDEIIFTSLILVGCGLFYLVLSMRRTPMLLRKMTKMNPLIFQPFVLKISEDGIENIRNEMETKFKWDFVKTVYEKLGGLIIVFQSNNFLFIPARKISEEHYLKVRKILAEKVGISED